MQSRYEQFLVSITSINRYIQKIERDEMIKYGYKGAYAQYLAVLNRHPYGLTSAQLSEICDRDKAAVSRMVAEMEEKGLVTRACNKENLYRAQLLLTEEGRRAAGFVCRQAQRVVEAGGRGMSDEERRRIYDEMALIAANLEMISREGIPSSSNAAAADMSEEECL